MKPIGFEMRKMAKCHHSKFHSFLEHGCTILSSFKIVIIFNNTSAEIKTKSADLLLKMITILKELRILQLCSKNEGTLANDKRVLTIGFFCLSRKITSVILA